jgi:hypothetical protein
LGCLDHFIRNPSVKRKPRNRKVVMTIESNNYKEAADTFVEPKTVKRERFLPTSPRSSRDVSSSLGGEIKGRHCPLGDSIAYPSGLLKLEDIPPPTTPKKPWYRDSCLDFMSKNDRATESAFSVVERECGITMAAHNAEAARRRAKNQNEFAEWG